MRLRTLPLSLAGVVCGFFMAWADQRLYFIPTINWLALPFLLLTTASLQVLSNLSNELGDYLSGTDGADREGPLYSLGQGNISLRSFKRLIAIFVVLCCLFGAIMTWAVFGTLWCIPAVVMLALGLCAIWAAMHYTLGKHPYGYRGLGDLFVFIFFGLVSVLGGYWVMAGQWVYSLWEILPAVGIGLFSIGVLNVNNIRDMASDAGTRVTIPLKIGEKRAKIYHTVLIVGGWICFLVFPFVTIERQGYFGWLFIIPMIGFITHLRGVWKRAGKALDPMLPLLVISTFLLSIFFGLGLVI